MTSSECTDKIYYALNYLGLISTYCEKKLIHRRNDERRSFSSMSKFGYYLQVNYSQSKRELRMVL